MSTILRDLHGRQSPRTLPSRLNHSVSVSFDRFKSLLLQLKALPARDWVLAFTRSRIMEGLILAAVVRGSHICHISSSFFDYVTVVILLLHADHVIIDVLLFCLWHSVACPFTLRTLYWNRLVMQLNALVWDAWHLWISAVSQGRGEDSRATVGHEWF